MDQNADIFPAYRLVAQFADGQRLTFDGLTGKGMTWNTEGEVSKMPAAVIIKNGTYVSAEPEATAEAEAAAEPEASPAA